MFSSLFSSFTVYSDAPEEKEEKTEEAPKEEEEKEEAEAEAAPAEEEEEEPEDVRSFIPLTFNEWFTWHSFADISCDSTGM